MKRTYSLGAALAVLSLSVASSQAQTQVSFNNLLFSENFSSYAAGTPPTTVANGGLWGTATWNGTNGSWGVTLDSGNVFGQGTDNQFLRFTSTHNLNPGLITPLFEPQDVLSFGFDFIGRYLPGDTSRWLNVDARAGTLVSHLTSIRMSNHTIRSDTNPSYGPNEVPLRIVTFVNNRGEAISYDRPDGSGTAELGSARASLWVYNYNTATWENVLPDYIYTRSATITTGAVMDNVRFFMDSNANWRSFDLDNIAVYGAVVVPEPSAMALLGLALPAWLMIRRRNS